MHDSHFGKPYRPIYYSYVLCYGDELSVTSCPKIEHTQTEGRQIFTQAEVAGVICRNVPKPVCVPVPEKDECTDGTLVLELENTLIYYCINGVWSLICHMTHNETTVACRELGHTTFSCELL